MGVKELLNVCITGMPRELPSLTRSNKRRASGENKNKTHICLRLECMNPLCVLKSSHPIRF